jgi:tellurite resistance protein
MGGDMTGNVSQAGELMMIMTKVEVLRAACCVAAADRNMSDRELAQLKRIADHVGVGSVSLDAMIERANRDPDFYHEMFRILQTDADNTLKVLFAVACADHQITDEERMMLYHFAKTLEMSDERFNQLLAAADRRVAQKGRGDASAAGEKPRQG